MDQRTRMLLEAPIVSTLLRLAAPKILVMLVQASIGLVEIYFYFIVTLDSTLPTSA
jgi:MATE family, multidrug efflux pump